MIFLIKKLPSPETLDLSLKKKKKNSPRIGEKHQASNIPDSSKQTSMALAAEKNNSKSNNNPLLI
jgi:hypothetical protein